MKASTLSFRGGVTLALAGMTWGLVMAISGNHAAIPAHTHLNLLGWVSLFLFGIFYHLHPSIDRSRVAIVQVSVWIIAVVVLAFGLGLLSRGQLVGETIAAASSMVVFACMLVFAWLVYTRE
jgi:cbb3-type cytochrome oxidase subunit 1